MFVSRDPADLSHAAYAFTTDSLPLAAEKVALPSEPGCVNLLDILPPDIARVYAEPNPDLFRPVDERPKARYACRVRTPQDYVLIIKRLHELKMVVFTTTPEIVNGAFGTAKSDGSQRLVFDGRPANAAFAPPPVVQLPAPDLLSRLVAESAEPIYVAKADLDNYYHRIRVPEWLHPYFALPPVRASELGLSDEYGAATMVYPCCTTLPMGWSHSCYVAQAGHEHIIDSRTELKWEDRITISTRT